MKVEPLYIESATFQEPKIIHKHLIGVNLIAETEEERNILLRFNEKGIANYNNFNGFENALHIYFADQERIRYYM